MTKSYILSYLCANFMVQHRQCINKNTHLRHSYGTTCIHSLVHDGPGWRVSSVMVYNISWQSSPLNLMSTLIGTLFKCSFKTRCSISQASNMFFDVPQCPLGPSIMVIVCPFIFHEIPFSSHMSPDYFTLLWIQEVSLKDCEGSKSYME